MSRSDGHPVPDHVVAAALRVAEARGVDAADVPLLAVAQEAGISRSTLVRRLGGTRRALDEAIRAAGVDPGGRLPVHDRALAAGAALISENGLASLSLERVATAARCSVHSLYAVFGGRDELLRAIFERYSPILDIEAVLADPHQGFEERVHAIHRLFAEALGREPRVVPAMLAEALARPGDEAVQALVRHAFPRMLGAVGQWLAAEAAAGHIRDLPPLLLAQQFTGPLLTHFLLRPAVREVPGVRLPPADEVCAAFADAFLRAVAPTSATPPSAADPVARPNRSP
ncbi:helix-turn-helix domain-containing protein [Streptomyces sp. NPDC000594]|uniref:TetR/AcrR family transcriptional regulator n=1 Tax=Streptomyces sp. NPDC000594 TaxID=3154261 RepID=UPI0033257B42